MLSTFVENNHLIVENHVPHKCGRADNEATLENG